MPKLSVTDYATRAGCTRQTIYNQIKAGTLFQGDDKKIDLDIRENFQYLLDCGVVLDDMKPIEKPPAKKRPKKKEITRKKKPTIKRSAGIPAIDAEEVLARLSSMDIRLLTPADVGKVARLETALKTRVEREHKRGLLIERDTVQTVFGKLYTVDSNELRTLAAKVAPTLAGMFGVDDPEKILKAEKVIDDEILKILGHIKRIMNDFLKKAGADAI